MENMESLVRTTLEEIEKVPSAKTVVGYRRNFQELFFRSHRALFPILN